MARGTNTTQGRCIAKGGAGAAVLKPCVPIWTPPCAWAFFSPWDHGFSMCGAEYHGPFASRGLQRLVRADLVSCASRLALRHRALCRSGEN